MIDSIYRKEIFIMMIPTSIVLTFNPTNLRRKDEAKNKSRK